MFGRTPLEGATQGQTEQCWCKGAISRRPARPEAVSTIDRGMAHFLQERIDAGCLSSRSGASFEKQNEGVVRAIELQSISAAVRGIWRAAGEALARRLNGTGGVTGFAR